MATEPPTGPPAREGGGAGIVVRIDHDMCSGTRNCERTYPDLFLVQNAKAWVRGDAVWERADVERLQTAESMCPWAAIEVDLDP